MPWILALVWVCWGWSALDQYGPNWDESYGDLFFGQRYASFWTSFDSRYLDFRIDPYPAGTTPDLRASPLRISPQQHYPVTSTFATLFARAARSLGMLHNPFDAVHAFNLLLAAFLIILMWNCVDEHAGPGAATAGVVLLMASPRVTYHALINLKDFGEMVLFAATLFVLYDAIERASRRGLILGGVLWGLALGTKANALFIPPIIVLWLVARGVPAAWSERRHTIFDLILLWPAIGIATLFASWPWLWADPISRLGAHLDYIVGRASEGAGASQASAVAMILYTTVPLTLVLAIAGFVIVAKRGMRRDSFSLLIIIWTVIVLIRASIGTNFDGVRHFLELFPPMAILAGIAIASAASLIESKTTFLRGRVAPALVVIAALPSLLAVATSHPFEATYWNVFAGGYPGAVARGLPQASDYWATSYRLGIDWLNEHAERDAALVVPIGEHTVRIARETLRPDIEIVRLTRFWTPVLPDGAMVHLERIAAARPLYGMTVTRSDWWNEAAQRIVESPRAAEWSHEGEPVLIISRLRE